MNSASLGRLTLLLLVMALWRFSTAEQEEDPDYIFSGDAVLFTINEEHNTPTSLLACSKNDCHFSKRHSTESFFSHSGKVFQIYGKGRLTLNDPIRYGDEVALFYRVNDNGDGLWMSCAAGTKRCGLGTCPGLPHLNHWMWNSQHSCNENKFVITESLSFQSNGSSSGQPLRIEHQIKLIKKVDYPSNADAKSHLQGRKESLIGTPFLANGGNWVIKKDMIEECGNKHYDVRHKICDRCGSVHFVRPRYEKWECCAGKKPYNVETSLCCEGSVSDLNNTRRSAKDARCCSKVAFFPDRQICCKGAVRDLPGQDTDADDAIVQCCGSEPYLSTHGICCKNVITPFYPLKVNSKDSLQCCDDQGFNKRTSFCYSCGSKKHVLPVSEKNSWKCCKDQEIYRDKEFRCCDYGVEKGQQCKCLFQNSTYISGQRFSEEPASTSYRSCVCNDGRPSCETIKSCPPRLPFGCSFYPANDECCPIFECFNDESYTYKLFLGRRSRVSASATIPEMNTITISFWMRTQQEGEGTVLSYANETQPEGLVITTHPRLTVKLNGYPHNPDNPVTLNDGNWHFLSVSWSALSGIFVVRGREKTHIWTERHHLRTPLQGGGYLVLGKRQTTLKKTDEAGAFVGEISNLNIWDRSKPIDSNIWQDFTGSASGNLLHLSDATIVRDHSASIIAQDYDLKFSSSHQVIVRINSPSMERFREFTVCFWMNSSSSQGTPFSYTASVDNSDRELHIGYENNQFALTINEVPRATSVKASDGFWHHICVTWKSNSGTWKFYRDGNLKDEGVYFKKNYQLPPGGSLVLGQSFHGMLSEVNVWDYELPAAQIKEISRLCLQHTWEPGNVAKWSDFLFAGRDEGLVQPSTCEPYVSETLSGSKDSGGDWVYWNGHYYNHQGKSAASSWYSAEGFCQQQGKAVHLASIHSREENKFVQSLSSVGEEQWIGLTDHNIELNSFKWMDNSAYGDFTHWADGEPNHATVDEDCGAMKPDGYWIDVACRKRRREGESWTFETRAFTCKTSGNTVSYGPLPVFKEELSQTHDPAISVAQLSLSGQSINIIFFTGLHRIAPNNKFSTSEERIQKGALLKFGGYVHVPQDQLGGDLGGVADLDGIVDKIEISHYREMSRMGSTDSPGFSIEFWLRPRVMPENSTPMALFLKSSQTSGFISLNLNFDGSLEFSATPSNGNPLTCTTEAAEETLKVTALTFSHIAVTGTVGRSLAIKVNGSIACQKRGWGGITILPASNDGKLIFGENELDQRQLKRFNGQIRAIELFSVDRTQEQIDGSNHNSRIGFWSLRQSDEINVVQYVITNSRGVSGEVQVLQEYNPPLTGFPVEAVVNNQYIHIIRLTEDGNVTVSQFQLSGDQRTLQPVPDHQRNESSQAKRSCLAATQNSNGFILIECFTEEQSPGALRFNWSIYDVNERGKITPSKDDRANGSLLVAGIGNLDTRLSAKVVGNHLFLTAGTTSEASTFFLDVTLADGFPEISLQKLVVKPIGPEVADSGATYYAYFHKESATSEKPFLRRIRQGNMYSIEVRDTDPASLVANAIEPTMPDNDWFWFLFKIRTFDGGNAIQSGEKINIETPDNNHLNENGWSTVKYNNGTLIADQQKEILNFWIFKTETCFPENGGFAVVAGEIGPNDCILLWPKIEGLEPGRYGHILAHPTSEQIQTAKETFGSFFGPWRLVIPIEPSTKRPIPVPAGSPSDSPQNVYEGNKYSIHLFGDGVPIEAQSGVRGGLLRFAKTTIAPVVVSDNETPTSVKLLFRGNGGPFPLAAFPHHEEAKHDVTTSTIYQEGSYAQRRMASGLFYSVAYALPSDSTPGIFKKISRIDGLQSVEYPDPPASFVWLIPPPLKLHGMAAAIATIFHFDDDKVNIEGPSSIASLTNVIKSAIGPGSFGEGLFKPFVSVHFNVDLLKKIGDKVHALINETIHNNMPKPPPESSISRPREGIHSWEELGYLKACVSLSNSTFWGDKVEKQKIKDRLTQTLQSNWMAGEIFKIRQEARKDFLRDASAKYSAYGGIAVLIANRLRSQEFLEELLTMDESSIRAILDSHLKILDIIRPDLGIEVRQDMISAMLAKGIIMQPWTIMQTLDVEDQRDAISMSISTIVDGNLPKEVQTTFKDVMELILNALLYPLTSTQLGVVSNFLDLWKLDVLSAVDSRARDFKDRFLDIFVQQHAESVGEVSRPPEPIDLDIALHPTFPHDRERSDEEMKKFLAQREMKKKRLRLREVFRTSLQEAGNPPAELPSGYFDTKIRENPRLVTGIAHSFNLLGAVAASYSILKEVSNPDSGFRQGNTRDTLSVIATAIGGVGSVKGTYDLAKVVKEKMFQPRTSTDTLQHYEFRQFDEFKTFPEELATEYAVDLNNMERTTNRVVQMMEPLSRLEASLFTVFGIVADGIFFGISVHDLYKDFTADRVDPWKVADDSALAAASGAGAVLGFATILEVGGAATGIGALVVIGIGLIAIISDAMRQKYRLEEEQCSKWEEWCSWSKELLDHYKFIKDDVTDPCSHCPYKKHQIFQSKFFNRHPLYPACEKALLNGLDSRKNIKILEKRKKKVCPAWLRHVFKGKGKQHRKIRRAK